MNAMFGIDFSTVHTTPSVCHSKKQNKTGDEVPHFAARLFLYVSKSIDTNTYSDSFLIHGSMGLSNL